MKKILIILILINTYIFSQTKLEQDKLLRESI
jgi:hypothetical protein